MVYSVLTEPVIPVLWPDGTNSAVGIREAFLRAHEIRDIQGETPLERYALLRLLIAFAMDMLHPRNSYERRDLLEAGQFDQEVFDQYVALCEKDGPRFDLFDPKHPFMQSRYDEKLDKELKSVANLFPALPTGHNHVFIDHRLEDNYSIHPNHALGALCVIYLFCFPAGHGYPSSVNNTPPIYITITGLNLFETIIINLLSMSEAKIEYGEGSAPWRIDCNVIPQKEFPNVSLIEAYTWMPRRITLKCDEDGQVRKAFFQQGHNFKGNPAWQDPHVPYRKDKEKRAFLPVLPNTGRALWRDVSTITYYDAHKEQPFILYSFFRLMDDEIPLFIPINMLGLIIVNNAKYVIWYEDTLSIPQKLLKDEQCAFCFRRDLRMIEEIQSDIYVGVKNTVDNPQKGDKLKKTLGSQIKKPKKGEEEKSREIATQCQQYFLHVAHDLLFNHAAIEIIGSISEKDHVNHFCNKVKNLIQETIVQVLHASGTDRRSIMQQLEAEKWIWFACTKRIEERMKGYAEA